ncbi:MAG: metallophosphoesterase [Bacteriovoracia bacterium]
MDIFEIDDAILKQFGNIWFTSDIHFMHTNIIKYCKRPFASVEEMDEVIISNWNESISKNDLVFFLGDFSMFKEAYTEILPRLQFKRMVFILGNHDRKSTLKEVASGNSCGEVEIYKKLIIGNNRKKYFLTHRPIDAHDEYPTICGHVHEKWVVLKKGDVIKEYSRKTDATKEVKLANHIFNVGVDVHNFHPIKLSDVITSIDGV